jgi:hypothetical protein
MGSWRILARVASYTAVARTPPMQTMAGYQTFVLEIASKLQIGIKACRHLELP